MITSTNDFNTDAKSQLDKLKMDCAFVVENTELVYSSEQSFGRSLENWSVHQNCVHA